jgi:hypothetical protein
MDTLRIAALGGDAKTAEQLKRLLPNTSLSTILHGLKTGEPFAELTFWGRDHQETTALARQLVAALHAAGLSPVLYEDEDEGPFSAQLLEDQFNSWEQDKRRLEELKKLGHK